MNQPRPGRPNRDQVATRAVDAMEHDDPLSLSDDDLDRWLRSHMPAQSRILIQEMIRRGLINLNLKDPTNG